MYQARKRYRSFSHRKCRNHHVAIGTSVIQFCMRSTVCRESIGSMSADTELEFANIERNFSRRVEKRVLI